MQSSNSLTLATFQHRNFQEHTRVKQQISLALVMSENWPYPGSSFIHGKVFILVSELHLSMLRIYSLLEVPRDIWGVGESNLSLHVRQAHCLLHYLPSLTERFLHILFNPFNTKTFFIRWLGTFMGSLKK